MKLNRLGFAAVVMAVVILGAGSEAQQPGKKDGPRAGGKKGDGFGKNGKGKGAPSALVRAVDDMQLPETKRETVVAAVRGYEDDGRRLANMAGASLLLKMKEIVGPEEFTKLRAAAERSRGGPGRLNSDSVVEHYMSFDKDKDGKISKDELPERMQDQFAKGDTNKDGFLDKEEIKKLAVELAKDQPAGGRQFAGPGGPGGGRGPGGRGNIDRGLPLAAVERAVNDLKLEGKTKETADAAIKANQADLRRMTEFARADLLLTMSEALSPDESKKLQAVLDRQPVFGGRPGGRDGRPGPPPPRFRP